MNIVVLVYTYFVVWFSFNVLFYLLKKTLKCHETLAPILTLAYVLIALYLSGILFGSLYFGLIFIVLTIIAGFIYILTKEKNEFGYTFINHGYSIQVFFIILLLLFIQNILYSKQFIQPDEIHHWGLIVKGMVDYNAINGFKNSYSNYTIGGALWAYFIHKLVGSNFNVAITLWSNTIISCICLIPGLRLFAIKKAYLPLIIVTYFLIITGNHFWQITGLIIVILFSIGLIIRSNIKNAIDIICFISYLLIFTFLSLMPGYEYVSYRTSTPDHIIFVIPAAILCAYISKPSFRTLLYVSPVAALPYLFKRPGNSIAIAIILLCIFHCIVTNFHTIRYALSNFYSQKKYLYYATIVIFCNFIFLTSPSLIWENYCLKSKRTSMFKFNKLPKKANELLKPIHSTDEKVTQIRNNFIRKIYNNPVFLVDHQSQFLKDLFCIPSFIQKYHNLRFKSLLTFPVFTVFIIISNIILFLFKSFRRKKFYIMSILFLLFYFLYVYGIFLNYVFNFDEIFIPAFERYISPILKLSIILTFILYTYCCLTSRSNSTAIIISIFILVFSFKIFNLSDRSFITKNFCNDYYQTGKKLSTEIPDHLNFQSKKVLFLSSSYTLTDPIRDFIVSAAFLTHNGTLPLNFYRCNIKDTKKMNEILYKQSYDYLWLHNDINYEKDFDINTKDFFKSNNIFINSNSNGTSYFYERSTNSFILL